MRKPLLACLQLALALSCAACSSSSPTVEATSTVLQGKVGGSTLDDGTKETVTEGVANEAGPYRREYGKQVREDRGVRVEVLKAVRVAKGSKAAEQVRADGIPLARQLSFKFRVSSLRGTKVDSGSYRGVVAYATRIYLGTPDLDPDLIGSLDLSDALRRLARSLETPAAETLASYRIRRRPEMEIEL